jgi:DNA-binding winged helix-turn-helix (wHTH) protein
LRRPAHNSGGIVSSHLHVVNNKGVPGLLRQFPYFAQAAALVRETTQSALPKRFGAFEFDSRARQLCKDGHTIRLHGQPLEIPGLLLERPAEVVLREELRARLWPEDTFVDFEHSLNAAVNKLREALGDDANNPRFIETVPRRGYWFIAPIEGALPTLAPGHPEHVLNRGRFGSPSSPALF